MLYLVQADLDMLRENTLVMDIYSKHHSNTRQNMEPVNKKKFIADEEVKKSDLNFMEIIILKYIKDELAFLLKVF